MRSPHEHNTLQTAGLVDLEHEIRSTPDMELLEAVCLLIELPPSLQPMCWPRLRLSVWELQRRAEIAGAA